MGSALTIHPLRGPGAERHYGPVPVELSPFVEKFGRRVALATDPTAIRPLALGEAIAVVAPRRMVAATAALPCAAAAAGLRRCYCCRPSDACLAFSGGRRGLLPPPALTTTAQPQL